MASKKATGGIPDPTKRESITVTIPKGDKKPAKKTTAKKTKGK